MTKVKCWSYLPIRSLTFLYLWVKWGVRNSSRRCKSSGTLHSCCTKAFWTANSRLKNTKQKHFIISSFTGIKHHIYCSFWRKGDECRYILSTTSFFVTFYLESSKDEDPSLIGFSMSSSKNLYSLCGSRLSETTVKKVPQSFIVSLVMFSREVLKIGITQSHRALTYSRKSLEINEVLQ